MDYQAQTQNTLRACSLPQEILLYSKIFNFFTTECHHSGKTTFNSRCLSIFLRLSVDSRRRSAREGSKISSVVFHFYSLFPHTIPFSFEKKEERVKKGSGKKKKTKNKE